MASEYSVAIRPGLRVKNSINVARVYQEMMKMEENISHSGDSLSFLERLVATKGELGLCLGFLKVNLPLLHVVDTPHSIYCLHSPRFLPFAPKRTRSLFVQPLASSGHRPQYKSEMISASAFGERRTKRSWVLNPPPALLGAAGS